MDDNVFDAALAEHEAELLADARAIAAAVYAEVGVIDRLRAAEGRGVIVDLGTLEVAGTVGECAADGVVIHGERIVWVVPLGSVVGVRGLAAGHLPAVGVLQQRSRLAMLIRRYCPPGAFVEVGLPHRRARGTLVRVGRDHFEYRDDNGQEVLPLAHVQWVRAPGRADC